MTGRLHFVLCIVFVLHILSIQNTSAFYILLKNLIKTIREGRISKPIETDRLIFKRLRKKDIPVGPELLEVVNFKNSIRF